MEEEREGLPQVDPFHSFPTLYKGMTSGVAVAICDHNAISLKVKHNMPKGGRALR